MSTLATELTHEILKYLHSKKIFAYRNNVGAVDTGHGFYSFGKVGSPDIIAILPGGYFCGIEIKHNRDRLRPAQVGFIKNAEMMGAHVLVVKDMDDFLAKFSDIGYN